MKKLVITAVLLLAGFASVAVYFGYQEYIKISSDDPRVWEETIVELENKTTAEDPAADAVLFVGSSSIRFWDTLKEDMAPMSVIQHGFGGSKIYDVVFYAERLITKWNAPKVVIFVGSNDINGNEDNDYFVGELAELSSGYKQPPWMIRNWHAPPRSRKIPLIKLFGSN